MWQHLTRNILLVVLAFSVRILYKYNLLADDDYVLVFLKNASRSWTPDARGRFFCRCTSLVMSKSAIAISEATTQ